MKRLIAACALLLTFSASAQVLFTYGKEPVTAEQFLRAYHKNNNGIKDEKYLRDYLDLYIASRLKIKEAKARKLDTFSHIVADLKNLRQQILPAYLNDKKTVEKLANEAFVRAQSDIRLAHIFISFKEKKPEELAAAKDKLQKVAAELKIGRPFSEIAGAYSDDPSAKANGGNIGWITVFTLPYGLENLAYATPAGKISPVYESKAGYHILYVLEKRKAAGRIRASEILLAFPPDADSAYKAAMQKRADSLYAVITKGGDFGKLAAAFSNDVVSSASNGAIPEFGIGDYDPEFEANVCKLKEGEVSRPFLTAHGYHIVQLLTKVPVGQKKTDSLLAVLMQRVEQSDRMAMAREEYLKTIASKPGLKEPFTKMDELWALSDSLLDSKKPAIPVLINHETTLLQIGKRKYKLNDWYAYAAANRNQPNGTGKKTYPELWSEFKMASANAYYADNLEEFNEEFRKQMNDYAEGNLFFEIMQKEVWAKAQKDSAALRRYFQKNSSKYIWNESADAVIFHAGNLATANAIRELVKGDPGSWQAIVNKHNDKAAEGSDEMNVSADSARFELSQIPNPGNDHYKPGLVTPALVNKADNTAMFAYIIRTYPKGEPRNFADAKAMVINDYQAEIEQKWLAALKKKYPVIINQKVWNELVKSGKW